MTLTKLDGPFYRFKTESVTWTKDGVRYISHGVDEMFIEDLLYKVWTDFRLDENELDVALNQMTENNHDVAFFGISGGFIYSSRRY